MFARKINKTNSAGAGAIDEETFLTCFEDVPIVQKIYGEELRKCLMEYGEIIKTVDENWSKRVDCIKRIRSLVKAGVSNYDEFCVYLNLLLPSFYASLRDLRSQVVRESCITVAYLSKNLALKFEHFAKSILSYLLNLIQKSAKVVSSSSVICIRFILQYTRSPRLIPIISNNWNSQSKDIRAACCEFINLILQTWHIHLIDKNASKIQNAVEKGITDTDAQVRAHARNAFSNFKQHFPKLAESLYDSLDYSYRKLLLSSNSGSNPSLSKSPSRSLSIPTSLRSNSAIDLQAVKRVRAKAQYATMDPQKFCSGSSSLPKSNKKVMPASEQRTSRAKSRISISTPNSRSGSPSSNFNYSNHLDGCLVSSAISLPKSNKKVTLTSEKMVSRTKDRVSVSTPNSRSVSPSPRYKYSGSPSSKFNYSNYLVDNLYGVSDISEIITKCENALWNERKEGLINLQYYIQEGNKLALSDLKRIMEVLMKIFNDPHIKVFSLFMDTLNELILSHSEDLCFCLHLLLTRLFNKLGTDLLISDHSKIKKALDNVFVSFPADIQLNSIFRLLVDPMQTPNMKVKLAAVNYVIRLTSIVNSCTTFVSSANGTNKDYAAMALNKMISWTMSDNTKSNSELRDASQRAIGALFNLSPSQITQRLSAMPKEFQETAFEICRSYDGSKTMHFDESPQSNGNDQLRKDSRSSLSPEKSSEPLSPLSESTCNSVLKTYLDKLPQVSGDDKKKKDSLTRITSLVQDSPSETIIIHFKPLLTMIISYISESELSEIKEVTLHLLQILVKRNTVTFLLKQYSDLIITKVLTMCSDCSKDVAKAAEQCAIVLSTHLPAESVVRVIVPLIACETVSVKLVTIKMLTRLVECSNDSIVVENIDQILPILLEAYDDTESSVRKAAVFCMVALHKQSDEMKIWLEPYIAKLQGPKLKLLQFFLCRGQSAENPLN